MQGHWFLRLAQYSHRRLSPHGKSTTVRHEKDCLARSAGRGDAVGGFGPGPDRDQAAAEARDGGQTCATAPIAKSPAARQVGRRRRPSCRPPGNAKPPAPPPRRRPGLRAAAAGHRARRDRRRGRPADRARHREPRPLPAHLPGPGRRPVGARPTPRSPSSSDKTLMGYVGAQRLLSQGYPARYDELAAWLQEYNDHPDAPAIYKLALARRTPGSGDLTPASFVGSTPGSPTFAAARTVTGADAAQAAELRARLQSMADDGGFNAAFVLLDRKSTVDMLGAAGSRTVARSHPHARARSRLAARRCRCRSRSACRPTPTGTPACRPSPAATWPRRRAASSWWPTRRPIGPRPGRSAAGCVLGGARQPAGRQSAEIRALSQARRAAWPHLPWPGRAEGARHADRAGLERAGPRSPSAPTCCATTAPASRALALLQLGATTAAERELYRRARSTPIRNISRRCWRSPRRRRCPASRSASAMPTGISAHRIAGYDGAMYPIPPWQPSGGFTRRPRAGLRLHAPGIGVQSQGALLRRRHGADAADARHRAARRDPLRSRARRAAIPTSRRPTWRWDRPTSRSLLSDVDNNLVRTAAGYNGGPGNVMTLGRLAERRPGSAALHRLDPAPRDARLRAARAGELLDLPDPARPADAVARPDRGPRMAALHRAGRRRPLMRSAM